MEHNPLLSFEDGLEVTYSDLKHHENGEAYITIYFERPNATGFFDSARINFPGADFKDVKGFTTEDLEAFREYVNRSGHTAFAFAKEDSHT